MYKRQLLQGKGKEQNISYVKENFRCGGGVRYLHICLNDLSALDEMSDEEVSELKDRIYGQVSGYLRENEDHLFKDFFVYEEDYEIGFIYCDYMAKERNLSEEEFMKALQKTAQGGSEKLPVILLVGKWVEDIAKFPTLTVPPVFFVPLKDFRIRRVFTIMKRKCRSIPQGQFCVYSL